MNKIMGEAMIEHLVLQNALTIDGYDQETGETIYGITNKLKEVSPDIYYQMKIQFEDHMFEMIQKGPEIMQWRLRQ